MKEYILFDLDGTLVNTYEGIIKCLYFALESLGIEESEPEKLTRFIGPPLDHAFKKYYNMSDAGAARAIAKYRERYTEKGIYECKLYAGMEEVVKTLAVQGKQLCVATAKPLPFAKRILEMFKIDGYFKVIVGASLDGSLIEKADIIAETLRQIGEVPIEQMIMIGDRDHDILGAKANNMQSVGIRHGFAEVGELEAAGADYIVTDADELLALLQTI